MIKSRRSRWTGNIARMEEDMSSFKIVTGKPTGKSPLERPSRRWEGFWRALMNATLNLRVP